MIKEFMGIPLCPKHHNLVEALSRICSLGFQMLSYTAAGASGSIAALGFARPTTTSRLSWSQGSLG